MPIHRLLPLALILALAVGGCDMPADPVPDNPYDPLYEGARIGTTPTGFRATSTTPTSVTFAWDDVSTFEASYRLERRAGRATSTPLRTTVVGRTGPDETSFTWGGLTSLVPKRVRLVLEVEGGEESAPTGWIDLVYPVAEVDRSATLQAARLSRDGQRAFAPAAVERTRVVDAATGVELGTLPFDEYSEAEDGRLVGWRSRGGQFFVAEGTTVVGEQRFDCYCNGTLVAAQSGRLVVNWQWPFLERMDLETGAFERRDLGAAVASEYRPAAVSRDERFVVFRWAEPPETYADYFVVYDLVEGAVAWRSQDAGARYIAATLLPGGEAVLAARLLGEGWVDAVPVVLDVATGAEIRASDLRLNGLASVSADGASFAYGWVEDTAGAPTLRVGVASTESLAPVRTALPYDLGDLRLFDGVEGWRTLDRGVVTTGRFDADWEAVPVDVP